MGAGAAQHSREGDRKIAHVFFPSPSPATLLLLLLYTVLLVKVARAYVVIIIIAVFMHNINKIGSSSSLSCVFAPPL